MDKLEQTCRLCLEVEIDRQTLIRPCKCSGSLQYIHKNCFSSYIVSLKKRKCDLCLYTFKYEKKYKKQLKIKDFSLAFIGYMWKRFKRFLFVDINLLTYFAIQLLTGLFFKILFNLNLNFYYQIIFAFLLNGFGYILIGFLGYLYYSMHDNVNYFGENYDEENGENDLQNINIETTFENEKGFCTFFNQLSGFNNFICKIFMSVSDLNVTKNIFPTTYNFRTLFLLLFQIQQRAMQFPKRKSRMSRFVENVGYFFVYTLMLNLFLAIALYIPYYIGKIVVKNIELEHNFLEFIKLVRYYKFIFACTNIAIGYAIAILVFFVYCNIVNGTSHFMYNFKRNLVAVNFILMMFIAFLFLIFLGTYINWVFTTHANTNIKNFLLNENLQLTIKFKYYIMFLDLISNKNTDFLKNIKNYVAFYIDMETKKQNVNLTLALINLLLSLSLSLIFCSQFYFIYCVLEKMLRKGVFYLILLQKSNNQLYCNLQRKCLLNMIMFSLTFYIFFYFELLHISNAFIANSICVKFNNLWKICLFYYFIYLLYRKGANLKYIATIMLYKPVRLLAYLFNVKSYFFGQGKNNKNKNFKLQWFPKQSSFYTIDDFKLIKDLSYDSNTSNELDFNIKFELINIPNNFNLRYWGFLGSLCMLLLSCFLIICFFVFFIYTKIHKYIFLLSYNLLYPFSNNINFVKNTNNNDLIFLLSCLVFIYIADFLLIKKESEKVICKDFLLRYLKTLVDKIFFVIWFLLIFIYNRKMFESYYKGFYINSIDNLKYEILLALLFNHVFVKNITKNETLCENIKNNAARTNLLFWLMVACHIVMKKFTGCKLIVYFVPYFAIANFHKTILKFLIQYILRLKEKFNFYYDTIYLNEKKVIEYRN